ncbi:MAG: hypothetical protein IJM59_13640 [Proteobacteria bacterium]|nr:hypothetical protein [Pseudomonadota bacterium]
MMNHNRFLYIITICAWLAAGCSLDEPIPFTGSLCGDKTEEVKGLLGGENLSHILELDPGQRAKYKKEYRCPQGYDYCVHPQSGAIEDKTILLCSMCDQGQMPCNTLNGGMKCVSVLSDRQNCGKCGEVCDECRDGICVNNEEICGNDSISCLYPSSSGSLEKRCVNPLSNDSCGATCENPGGEKCTADRECIDGTCTCRRGTMDCSGQCLNLDDDVTCGTSCDDAVSCLVDEGQHCLNGQCECPEESHLMCDGHCVDSNSSDSCGNSCDTLVKCIESEGQFCQDGKCTCPDGQLLCDGHCVDSNSSDSCGNSCDTLVKCIESEGQFCQDGKCTCPDGHLLCDGHCVSSNKPDSCGKYCSTLVKCIESEGQFCQNGECTCPDGQLMCSRHCVDPNLPESCGTDCKNLQACSTKEWMSCNNGQCTCPEGLLLREGHCIDPMWNNKYCGANDTDNPNGTRCGITQDILDDKWSICIRGACTCLTGSYMKKNGVCINTNTDNNYCGSIPDEKGELTPNKCPGHAACKSGNCVCDIGYHIAGDQCVPNENHQCGARGHANSNQPFDDNYMGYGCPDGTECKVISVPAISSIEPWYSISIDACQLKTGHEITWDKKYSLYKNGEVIAYANPNRVEKCWESDEYNYCECKKEYGGNLCETDLDPCEQIGLTCASELVCAKVDGMENPQCICPHGMTLVDNNQYICIKETSGFWEDPKLCGTQRVKCSENEICSNGSCAECGVNQTACFGLCLEKYDIALHHTEKLTGLKERTHIEQCTDSTIVCTPGYGSCDLYPWNCETDLTTKENCGSCGNACGRNTTCDDGKCCLTAGYDYMEETFGEYQNAHCCSGLETRLCERFSLFEGTNRRVYHCRQECRNDETDVTP